MKLHVSSGYLKNSILQVPNSARPIKNVVKQALFTTLKNLNAIENANVLDLYAGSGAIGIEALSNGASNVTFVEKDNLSCEHIISNAERLNISDKIEVITKDSLKFLGETSPDFTLVFADPPYNEHHKHLLKTAHLALVDGGIFVFAHAKKEPSLEAESLQLLETRTYGKSAFSLYKA